MVEGALEQPTSPDHDHEFQVTQVDFADGVATTELTCQTCGAVWFQ